MAGTQLRGYRFDRAYASMLTRAIDSLKIVLEVLGQAHIPIEMDQALNERMYGDLQGLKKDETAKRMENSGFSSGVGATMSARRAEKAYKIQRPACCPTMNGRYSLTCWRRNAPCRRARQ